MVIQMISTHVTQHSRSKRDTINTTLIKCAKGQTIMVQHDTSTPRAYSRIHLVQGSLGMARKWPRKGITLHSKGHRWLDDEEMKEIEAEYQHPLTRTIGDIAKKVGGHGGMDFIMDYRLIYCLKNGLPLDQDVYDAAAWSSVGPPTSRGRLGSAGVSNVKTDELSALDCNGVFIFIGHIPNTGFLGDLFGKHIIIAARVANLAEGGQILASGVVREIASSRGDIDFGPAQKVELKGIEDEYTVHDVVWQD